MPRIQRLRDEFSTYHVIMRGNEKKNIFWNDDDRIRFLTTIAKAKGKYNFLVYAYCLMNNHVHLLIGDNGNDISILMKSINVSYVSYFNRVYLRCGHLFQDRFKSQLVKDDRYLLEVSRYIHNNPVKAKIAAKPEDFRWSSYNIYCEKADDEFGILQTELILGFFSGDKRKSILEYEKFVTNPNLVEENMLDIEDLQESRNQDKDYINGISSAKVHIEQILAKEKITMEELIENKQKRNQIIKYFRRNSSLSLMEIGQLFGGISISQIRRIASSGVFEKKGSDTV